MNERLGQTELIDAIAHRLERLLDGELLDAFDLLVGQRELELSRGNVGGPLKGREAVLHDSRDVVGLGSLGALDDHRTAAVAGDACDGYVRGGELPLEVLDRSLDGELERLLGLHLEHEMHSALQIEAEPDGLIGEHRFPPRRQRRCE